MDAYKTYTNEGHAQIDSNITTTEHTQPKITRGGSRQRLCVRFGVPLELEESDWSQSDSDQSKCIETELGFSEFCSEKIVNIN